MNSQIFSIPLAVAVAVGALAGAIFERLLQKKKGMQASASSRAATNLDDGIGECVRDFAVIPPHLSATQQTEFEAKGLKYLPQSTHYHFGVNDHCGAMAYAPDRQRGGWTTYDRFSLRKDEPPTFIWPPQDAFYLCWADYPKGLEIGVLGRKNYTRDDVKLFLRPNHIHLKIDGITVLDSAPAREIAPSLCGFQLSKLDWRHDMKGGLEPSSIVKIYLAKAKPGWWWKAPLKSGTWTPPVNFRVLDPKFDRFAQVSALFKKAESYTAR